jgi:hypothetical protein
MAKAKKKSMKKEVASKEYAEHTLKKIGSIPLGYSDEDMVFFLNGKIYIAKRTK